MNEVKQDFKKMLGFAGALILVFLVIRYWEKLEGLISVGIGAATPLIIGCAMAYVINILMGFFEKWYDKIFKVDIALKIKRVVCLILAFLSLFGIVTLIINLVLRLCLKMLPIKILFGKAATRTLVSLMNMVCLRPCLWAQPQ